MYSAVAYAATKNSGANGQKAGNSQVRQKTTEEKFQESLDRIREAGTDRAKLKVERDELDKLDASLQEQFKETEGKINGLPDEIKKRHREFVKKYEENKAALKSRLDGIEQAKTDAEAKAAEEKVKAFLEKTKAPSRHQKLDPNNLPFRARKATKTREPYRKKDEFEKNFPKQKSKTTRTAFASDGHPRLNHSRTGLWPRIEIKEVISREWTRIDAKPDHTPILLAYNSSIASDIPFTLPRPISGERTGLAPAFTSGPASAGCEGTIPHSEFRIPNLDSPPSALETPLLMVAAATTDLPTSDDLAETPEIQFTEDIKAKAQELGCSAVKLFEFTKNEISFAPTYGSIQGADMCLQTKECNSIDTSSLLISLLRSCSIPARYVAATVEIPIDKVNNWVGGFSDSTAALTLMASGGIPVAAGTSVGTITKARLEQIFVQAYIPYGNYRGARMDDSLKTWIPMDGSFKQYTYKNGFDITATVPFNQDEYLSQVQSQNAVHYYQSKIQEYLDTNMPDTSIVDVKGYREITQETFHFLPPTLPYVTVAKLGTFSSLSSSMAASATFTITDESTGSAVSYSARTSELAGKRLTVSYTPATADDEALIEKYGGFLYDVPAYMLNLKPVLKIEGVTQLTGETTTLGAEQTLTIQFSQPGLSGESISKKLLAGAYYAVGLDLQGVNENVLGKRNYHLTTNVLSDTAGTLGNDDLIGEHLHILATTYFLANDKIYKSGAKLYNAAVTRTISEAITSFPLAVTYLFSIPKTAMPSGVEMDVAMDRLIVVAKDSDVEKEKNYMDIAGLVSSYHEHDVFEKIDDFYSVSAVRALQYARETNISIYTINSSNISQLMPLLEVGEDVKQDIQDAVGAGKEVTISQTNVQIYDWIGVGYIIKDTLTGSGTYRISGGLGGALTALVVVGVAIVAFYKGAYGWVKDRLDSQTRRTIVTIAELEIGENIATVAMKLTESGPDYSEMDCAGLVRRAYSAAGICLDQWSKCRPDLGRQYNIPWNKENGATYLYLVANNGELSPYGGIISAGIPGLGDIVFFDYGTKVGSYNHVGVVTSLPDNDGTIKFVDTTASNDADENNMNLLQPSNGSLNEALLRKPCSKCYAGELFAGFGTVRDPKEK
jgi:cell wall-associated NlpC family hydrolase